MISGNNASGDGGGVFVNSGIFTKTGGTIYGNDAGANRNTAGSSLGHAAYYNGSSTPIDHTMGPRVTGNIHWH
jgi:hypothetical protein